MSEDIPHATISALMVDGYINTAQLIHAGEDLTPDQWRLVRAVHESAICADRQRTADETRAESEGIAIRRHRRMTRRHRYAI